MYLYVGCTCYRVMYPLECHRSAVMCQSEMGKFIIFFIFRLDLKKWVISLQFSPDDKLLVCRDNIKAERIYDTSTWALVGGEPQSSILYAPVLRPVLWLLACATCLMTLSPRRLSCGDAWFCFYTVFCCAYFVLNLENELILSWSWILVGPLVFLPAERLFCSFILLNLKCADFMLCHEEREFFLLLNIAFLPWVLTEVTHSEQWNRYC